MQGHTTTAQGHTTTTLYYARPRSSIAPGGRRLHPAMQPGLPTGTMYGAMPRAVAHR
jgi:hypothetical protein